MLRLLLLLTACLTCSASYGQADGPCWEYFRNRAADFEYRMAVTENTDRWFSLMDGYKALLQELVGCPMLPFRGTSVQGKVIDSKQLAGKIVVMNFMYIGCRPCIAELPALNRLAREYGPQGVVFVAIAPEPAAVLKSSFLPRHPFAYQLIGSGKKTIERYGVSAFPENLIISPEGNITYLATGGLLDARAQTHAYNHMKPTLDKLLAAQRRAAEAARQQADSLHRVIARPDSLQGLPAARPDTLRKQ